MHYARIPRAYWRDRLRKARAMGLNTIETYVFWGLHEAKPGIFDFRGERDIASFLRAAQQEGLSVILRPGPYVCAEWDAGGLPAWLFADPTLRVRSADPRYLMFADRYLRRLAREVAPLLVSRGGPVIAVQIENEYGSFGNDPEYLKALHRSFLQAGFGDAILFTADGPTQTPNGSLPGVLATVNFSPGEAKSAFAHLSALRPGEPLMSGEFWAGWFDVWGSTHARTDADAQSSELDWMLAQGYSVNLYLFHGGTSFGFTNGANFQGGPEDHYTPQVTSYDYDAALDEAGRPTRKYYLFRDVIQRRTGVVPPPLPAALPIKALPAFTLTESASLWDNLPTPIVTERPQAMEVFGQAHGYILYRTEVTGPADGDLIVDDLRDYAAVYVDQACIGVLDRRFGATRLAIHLKSGRATLDLLVENTGRVNYGPHLPDGRAGITRSVSLAGREITGWKVFPLPMHTPTYLRGWSDRPASGPAFHRGTFPLDDVADTYLDTSRLGKGFVWVNGHNLGRVWSIGPQHSLFLPAPWLRRGRNEVVLFDYTDLGQPTLRGVTDPIWLSPRNQE